MTEDKYYFEKFFSRKNFKFSKSFDKEILHEISLLKKEGDILDLGCGEGGLAIALAKRGYRVTAMDISKTAIGNINSSSKKNNLKIRGIIGDLDNHFPSNKFDLIVFTGVSHFIKKPRDTIKTIRKNTKAGGVNILDVLINRDLTLEKLKKDYSDRWEIKICELHNESFGKMAYIVAIKKS